MSYCMNTKDDKLKNLPYDPSKLERELTPYYISATDNEIEEMLSEIGKERLEDLFDHIPAYLKFDNELQLEEELSYPDLVSRVENLASKNKVKGNFIGD